MSVVSLLVSGRGAAAGVDEEESAGVGRLDGKGMLSQLTKESSTKTGKTIENERENKAFFILISSA